MDSVLLLARLALSCIFFVAGFAKLADLPGSRRALAGFGLPVALANPFGLLLPIAEIVLAAAMLAASSAHWAALGVLALLCIFSVAIAFNLARGKSPDCHCFGQIHSAPAGWSTLARNIAFAAIALLVAYRGPGPSIIGWMDAFTRGETVLLMFGVGMLALFALQTWATLQLIKQGGRVLLRLEAIEKQVASGGAPQPAAAPAALGLPVGTPAPPFTAESLDGESMTLNDLRRDDIPVMLFFSDPGCGPCDALLPDIARWQCEAQAQFYAVLISRGDVEANRKKARQNGLDLVLLQREREISESYQAAGTPTAVLIGGDGKIASSLAGGADAIRGLVARTINAGLVNIVAKRNDPAPAFTLPDLSGTMVPLASFRSRPVLLLFWNPGCGFCSQMLDDLKKWESRRSREAPELVVISTGTVESNRAQGFRSTVLLDENFSIGRAFGAQGTPSAVLLDQNGRITTDVIVGGPNVLSLAAGQPVA